jgi:hypothetical protein
MELKDVILKPAPMYYHHWKLCALQTMDDF